MTATVPLFAMALCAGLVGIFEMIGRQRAIFGGKGCAMQVGKLVGMQLDRQAMRLGGIEDQPHLVGRKGDAFAEAIDGIGKAFNSDGRAASRLTTLAI